MKRILLIALSIILILSLYACGNTQKPEKYCWNCGEGISKVDSFCGHCGVSVKDNHNETVTSNAETSESSTTSEPSESQEPVHTHTYSTEVIEATCTEKGYTTYTCSCGDTYTADETAAKGHSYTDKVTAPTCTNGGYTTHTCACGDTYTDSQTSAKGHSYTKRVTEPTCTKGGYTTYTCSCGDSYTDSQTSAKGHSYTKKITSPTCTKQGYTTYTCTCGDSYKDNYTNPSHSYSNYKCTKCGTIDKSHAYEYLIVWVTENGVTNGSYTDFEYEVDGDYYSLTYAAQYDLLSVCRTTYYEDSYIFAHLQLDVYYYYNHYTVQDIEIEMGGYIEPHTFTSNTAISWDLYNGDPSIQSEIAEMSRENVCDLINWLKWFLDAYDIDLTIKDLGLKSF